MAQMTVAQTLVCFYNFCGAECRRRQTRYPMRCSLHLHACRQAPTRREQGPSINHVLWILDPSPLRILLSFTRYCKGCDQLTILVVFFCGYYILMVPKGVVGKRQHLRLRSEPPFIHPGADEAQRQGGRNLAPNAKILCAFQMAVAQNDTDCCRHHGSKVFCTSPLSLSGQT